MKRTPMHLKKISEASYFLPSIEAKNVSDRVQLAIVARMELAAFAASASPTLKPAHLREAFEFAVIYAPCASHMHALARVATAELANDIPNISSLQAFAYAIASDMG